MRRPAATKALKYCTARLGRRELDPGAPGSATEENSAPKMPFKERNVIMIGGIVGSMLGRPWLVALIRAKAGADVVSRQGPSLR